VILVDSSACIDFFRRSQTPEAEQLNRHLETESLLVGDLILTEVLRGFTQDRGFQEARRLLGQLDQITLGGEALAVEAARNHRRLRARGLTVRGTVDLIIATRCIVDGLTLLHNARDFGAFEKHLGLRVVDCGA